MADVREQRFGIVGRDLDVVDGQIVGSVGVIGPTRMAYERVIPIVDITAKLLSSALTYQAGS